jgi:hypothetical protein
MHVKDAQSTSSCPIMLGIILNVYESRVITGSLLETKLPQTLGLRVKLANRMISKTKKRGKNKALYATHYRSPIVASTLPEVVPRSIALLAFPF